MSDESQESRAPRESVMLMATVRCDDAAPTQHRVINLSRSGACIAGVSGWKFEPLVHVTVGGAHALARVIWVRGDRAGLRFDSQIDMQLALARRGGVGATPPSAGWMTDIDDIYRSRPHR